MNPVRGEPTKICIDRHLRYYYIADPIPCPKKTGLAIDNMLAYHPLVDLQKELEASMSICVLVQLSQRSHERNLQAYLLVVRRLCNLDSKDETNIGFEELIRVDIRVDREPVFHTVKLMQLDLFVLFRDWEGALICLTEAQSD